MFTRQKSSLSTKYRRATMSSTDTRSAFSRVQTVDRCFGVWHPLPVHRAREADCPYSDSLCKAVALYSAYRPDNALYLIYSIYNYNRGFIYLEAPSVCGWLSPWSPCVTGKVSALQRWGALTAPWRGRAPSAPCWPEETWGVSQCCGPPSYTGGSWRCACMPLHLGGRKPRGWKKENAGEESQESKERREDTKQEIKKANSGNGRRKRDKRKMERNVWQWMRDVWNWPEAPQVFIACRLSTQSLNHFFFLSEVTIGW